ncbi:hypothetical protein ACTA71_012106 [Dictyostelium dimigraforme]
MTPLNCIESFSQFFSNDDFQNVKYFNFTILIGFRKTDTTIANKDFPNEDELLEILFGQGLKYSSLQFISIDFKYYNSGDNGKFLSIDILFKLLNSIQSNKRIKGILFGGIDKSFTYPPNSILNFSLYPFYLENGGKRSIYYFIQ